MMKKKKQPKQMHFEGKSLKITIRFISVDSPQMGIFFDYPCLHSLKINKGRPWEKTILRENESSEPVPSIFRKIC